MGRTNVAAVYVRWGGKLDDGAMRLLTWMALVSLDPENNPMIDYAPCHYWQGWEAQAEALGYRDIPADGAKRANVRRSVQRVRHRLVEAGAIVQIRGSARHRSQTWLIVTDVWGDSSVPAGATRGYPLGRPFGHLDDNKE